MAEHMKDTDFGVVEVKTCDFCNKTVKREFYYPLQKGFTGYLEVFNFVNSNKKIKEGICFNCMLKGIFEVCHNDVEEIKEYLALYIKNGICDKMEGKRKNG